ncbi:Alpha-1,3-mannosyl-glycoprotein 2-beta-N-acetylglucosaminyltransferase [Morella rubra]|uniref:Alpha-1,3-mannosyl-glycoprotein 2-beta-N-acetylglucosaminyltransferase n=1 Tax=Morella rubra TaxID=262757 RepID=A0A6A1UF75_9ROSI|nr:Alpha-1,3-mannosyl-glycoprotein 2-beta-N-acetylglucosaminyltransferase [Morella rubra]KAB1199333.1 Alpha-1,3-mannosyl-glycoprotein 2-beta-N-acetylglucosaminyltransferase [Morella rubra]
MANVLCDYRFLLLVAAVAFIYVQLRLSATQTEYADKLAASEEAENVCTSQMRLLIDQISMQQGRIVSLEEERKLREQECGQLKALVEELERKGLQRRTNKEQVPVAAVVIMACSRADYLERTIKSVLKYQSSVASKYPLFVSQDGTNPDVKSKALSYDELGYMQHLDFGSIKTESPGELIAYYKIARHYKWALDELFYKHNFSRVIILEDDMEIAPDFFDYFEATATLLEKDKSIMAVSSWNDNGQKQFVNDPYLYPFWCPTNHLRRIESHTRLCGRLELLCATGTVPSALSPSFFDGSYCVLFHFCWRLHGGSFVEEGLRLVYPVCICGLWGLLVVYGLRGSSLGQFFKQYLEPIKMNDVKLNFTSAFSFPKVDWKSMDLSYLMEEKFTKHFADLVKKAKPLQGSDVVLKAYNIDGDVRIQYRDQFDFERIARQFGIFEEWKDGIPRTAYKGVVVFRYQTPRRVFLIGPDSLKKLGIEGA